MYYTRLEKLQFVHVSPVITDEEVWLGKLRLGRPVAGEVDWGERETARRYFTGVNECEFFEVEVGISEDIGYTDGSTAAARWTGYTMPTPSQTRSPRPLTSSTQIHLYRGGS